MRARWFGLIAAFVGLLLVIMPYTSIPGASTLRGFALNVVVIKGVGLALLLLGVYSIFTRRDRS